MAKALWAVVLLVGCAEIDRDATRDETRAAATVVMPVNWIGLVGVTASGNDLSKTDGSATWRAGAASAETIVGPGYVEFTTSENTTAKMAGLSNGNSNPRYADIDFAIYLKANGRFGVYEDGVLRGGNFGAYAAGDLFRVENDDGVVTYWHDGVVFYTSTVTATEPLLVDTSLLTPGATIDDAVLVGTSIGWMNATGMEASGNDLVKSAPESSWLAGIASVDTIGGNGHVQFTTGENTTAKMAGLSNGDGGPRYTDIDYAIHLKATGRFGVYEGGVLRGGNFGTYVAGDLFRIDIAGGVVTYSHNGVVFYTSAVPPVAPLLVDTSFYTPGATIQNVHLVDLGACTAGNTQCTNCVDDDGDGRVDGSDPECTGAIDDDESSFASGIAGDNKDDKWQDCFFDGNSGAGDDGCMYHTCCLLGTGPGTDCPVDPNFDPVTDCPAQTPGCQSLCQPITPPGCDCFGCCTLCDAAGCADVLIQPAVAPNCSYETLHDPSVCPSCVKAPDCGGGDCGGCVLCPGQDPATRPPGCTPSDQCPAGETPCTSSAECSGGEYCSSSECCIAVVP